MFFSSSSYLVEVYAFSMSVFIIASFVGSLLGGILADTYGANIVVVVSPFLVFLVLLSLSLLLSDYGSMLLAIVLPLIGLIGGLGGPAVNSLLAQLAPRTSLGRAYSMLTALTAFGELLGPLIAGSMLVVGASFSHLFIVLSLLVFLAFTTRLPLLALGSSSFSDSRDRLRNVWMGLKRSIAVEEVRRVLVYSVVCGAAEALYATFLIPYLRLVMYFSVALVTISIVVVKVTHILAQPLAALIIERKGPIYLLRVSSGVSFLATVLLLLAPYMGLKPYHVVMVLCLAALGMILNDPAVKTIIAQSTVSDSRSTMFSILNNLVVLSRSPIAAIGGLLWHIHPATVYALSAALFALSAATIKYANRAYPG